VALSEEEIWRRYDAIEPRLTASVSERICDLAELRPGMRVLDIATGRGEPALCAAERVGAQGQVLGIDLGEGLLEMAREKAVDRGLANLDLRVGNAENLEGVPEQHFDVATSRWALMYMRDPVAALSGVRAALVPGGCFVTALWTDPDRMRYATLPRRALEKYHPMPPIDFEAPGVHRYGDFERIERHFAAAGLRVEHSEEMAVDVFEAKTPAEVITWLRRVLYDRLL